MRDPLAGGVFRMGGTTLKMTKNGLHQARRDYLAGLRRDKLTGWAHLLDEVQLPRRASRQASPRATLFVTLAAGEQRDDSDYVVYRPDCSRRLSTAHALIRPRQGCLIDPH